MKRLLVNKWVNYYIPLTLILFSIITIERVIEMDGIDRLYGLPFGYRTGNAGCTGCYILYVIPLIADLLIYLVFVLLLFKVVAAFGLKLKTYWSFSIIGGLISILIITLFFDFPDSFSYAFYYDYPYKVVSAKLLLG